MMRKLVLLSILSVLSISIFGIDARAQEAASPTTHINDQNMMSVLWFQTSGEVKALYYQGYNLGKMRLDEILKRKKKALKPAVVLDIDETIVDNSPFQAWEVCQGKSSSFNWDHWVKRSEAKPLPGALDFLKYAKSKGVEIYYISNRKEAQKTATIRNLKQIGAPMADQEHVFLMKPGEKGKEARRIQVARTHDILLLFGDNLGDFSGFDHLSADERGKAVAQQRAEFGRKLIVFPNPMYGDWEEAIYKYRSVDSDTEKAKLRRSGLNPMHP